MMGSLLKLAGSEMKFGLCHEAGRSIEAKVGCLSTGITIWRRAKVGNSIEENGF